MRKPSDCWWEKPNRVRGEGGVRNCSSSNSRRVASGGAHRTHLAGCIKLSEGNKHTKILQIEDSLAFPASVELIWHQNPPGSSFQTEIDSHNVFSLLALGLECAHWNATRKPCFWITSSLHLTDRRPRSRALDPRASMERIRAKIKR